MLLLSKDASKADDPGAEAKAVEDAIARAMKGLSAPIDLNAVFPQPTSQGPVPQLMKDARAAFDSLDADGATQKYRAAIDAMEKNLEFAESRALAEAHLMLALTALTLRTPPDPTVGAEEMRLAAALDTNQLIDVKTFGADVRKTWEKTLKELNARPKVKLAIDSIPSGASVMIRKRKVGVTPLTPAFSTTPGRQVVRFTLPGYVPTGTFVDANTDAEVRAVLPPLPEYAAQRKRARETFTAAGCDVAKNASIAEALRARFLISTIVEVGGTGVLRAFDAERGTCLGPTTFTASTTEALVGTLRSFLEGRAPAEPPEVRPATVTARPAVSPTTPETVMATADAADTVAPRSADVFSTLGGRTLGRGAVLRGRVLAGTAQTITSGVVSVEGAYVMALRPNLDIGFGLLVPLVSWGATPGVEARWRLSGDDKLVVSAIGSVSVPLGFARGFSVGVAVTPGIAASYQLSARAEVFASLSLSYNHLFWSNPSVIGTGRPGLMGTGRLGLSYQVAPSLSVFGVVEGQGGYQPLRRMITAGNSGLGVSLSASITAGVDFALN